MKEVDTTQKVLIKNMRAEMKLGKKIVRFQTHLLA